MCTKLGTHCWLVGAPPLVPGHVVVRSGPHRKQNQESAEMPTTLRVIRVNLAPTSHGSIIWHVGNGNTANRQSNARASGVAKIGKHRAPPITSPMSLALCRSHSPNLYLIGLRSLNTPESWRRRCATKT